MSKMKTKDYMLLSKKEIIKQHIGPNRAERRKHFRQRVREASPETWHPKGYEGRKKMYEFYKNIKFVKEIKRYMTFII